MGYLHNVLKNNFNYEVTIMLMKPNYYSILNEYMDACNIYESYAMEADAATGSGGDSGPADNAAYKGNTRNQNSNNDSLNDTNTLGKMNKSLSTMIANLVDKCKAAINAALLRMQNRLKLLLETDKGYTRNLRERQIAVKPVQNLQITTYQYNNTALKLIQTKITAEYNKVLQYFVNIVAHPTEEKVKDIDTTNPQAYINIMIQNATGNKELKSVNDFFNYVKDKFRGKKVTYVYSAKQLPQIVKLSEDTSAYNALYNKCKMDGKKVLTNLDTLVKKFKYQNPDNKEMYKKLVSAVNLMSQVNTFYNAFLRYLSELYIERTMSYRAICKKFYQF